MNDRTKLTVEEVEHPLQELSEHLSGENGRMWLEALERFLRRENPWGEIPLLTPLSRHPVGPITEPFNVNKFFNKSKKIDMYSEHTDSLITQTKVVESAGPASLLSFDLTYPVGAAEITALLPNKKEVQLWQIAHLLKKQINGEPGSLATNGSQNVFFTKHYPENRMYETISLRWDKNDSLWRCDQDFPGSHIC